MKTTEQKLYELEEYYENAGFENVFERKLKNISPEEIESLYNETFKKVDLEKENWEMEYRGEK